MKRPSRALLSAMLTVLVAGCADGTGPATTPPPTSSAPTVPAPTAPTPDEPAAGWQTAAVTVRHDVPVPPVPVVSAIRHARHPAEGYDRVVLDITGPVPGYDVRYVARPVADGTGEPVTMPGRRFLRIRLEPADAHDQAGASTVVRSATLGYPVLEAYAVTGDFEGVVTVVLGLADEVAFRVAELPGRVYVDVAA